MQNGTVPESTTTFGSRRRPGTDANRGWRDAALPEAQRLEGAPPAERAPGVARRWRLRPRERSQGGDRLFQLGLVLAVEGDGLGAAERRVVELPGEGVAVRPGDAGALEDPEVKAELEAVGVLAGAALLGFVEDALAEVGAVEFRDERGAVRGLGGDEGRALAAGVTGLVEEAAEGDGLGLLLHPEAAQGVPRLAGADGVVPHEHPADA